MLYLKFYLILWNIHIFVIIFMFLLEVFTFFCETYTFTWSRHVFSVELLAVIMMSMSNGQELVMNFVMWPLTLSQVYILAPLCILTMLHLEKWASLPAAHQATIDWLPFVFQVTFEDFKDAFVAVLSRSLDLSMSEDDSSYLEPGES